MTVDFYNIKYDIYIHLQWKLYWLIFHIFIRMIMQNNSYVYFKIYFKREREKERGSLNRNIFHTYPYLKNRIYFSLLRLIYIQSQLSFKWNLLTNYPRCRLLQRELLRFSRKRRPNIVRFVHEYKLSVLIAFFKESIWKIWSINTRNDLTVF